MLMHGFYCPSRPVFSRSRHVSLFVALAAVLMLGTALHAQAALPPGTSAQDAAVLKPPAGAHVAIIEFSDLQCPACAHANPLLQAAASKYHIPWVHHDLLIPSHNWSPVAAVNARWFDSVNPALGEEYRDQIFANQSYIYNLNMLRMFTSKFATDHHAALPVSVDPQGKLMEQVRNDTALGLRLGIQTTPSIWIVTINQGPTPFRLVANPDQDLYQAIDLALASTASIAKYHPKKPTGK